MELAHDPDVGVVDALTLGPLTRYLLAAGSTKLLRNVRIDPRDLRGLPRSSPIDSERRCRNSREGRSSDARGCGSAVG
jgi:hypothetical protein